MIRRTACALIAVLVGASFAPAAEKELHVVALHEGYWNPVTRPDRSGANVLVNRPGKEVVLVVSSDAALEWVVTATPETKITRVLMGGPKRQTAKVPAGLEPEELSLECVKQRILPVALDADHRPDTVRFRRFILAVSSYTKLEVASFQGVYRFDPKKPFVVDAVQQDERLSADFPKVVPAAQLPKFKFDATRLVFGKSGLESASFGEFTQAGPTANTFAPLPKTIRRVIHDTKAERRYGIEDRALYVLDTKLRLGEKLLPTAGAEISWPRALVYDAKRERVIFTDGGRLVEYIPKDGKWKLLANSAQFDAYHALAWQQKTDTLFAFGTVRERSTGEHAQTLFQLKTDGTAASKTTLPGPFPPLLDDYSHGCHAELIDIGDDLALLVHHTTRDSGTGARGKPETFLYVIDPKTGKAKLAWKE